MTPTELRLRLLHTGFNPLPLYGKAPSMLKNWQAKFDTNDQEIAMWAKQWPDATNTGALCRFMPTLDVDVLHADAVEAIKELITERFEERGYVSFRTGKAPKCATPFRTDAPFVKLTTNLIAPDGSPQKLEFLADGQQVVVGGEHPETHQPYGWHGGRPGEIAHRDLPYITGAEAHQLIEDLAKLLIEQFGFKHFGAHGGKPGNDQSEYRGEDWAALINNIRDGEALHDSLRDLAAKMIAARMLGGAVVIHLRALMDASPAAHDERWTARYGEIPRMVASAETKFRTAPSDFTLQGEKAAGAAASDPSDQTPLPTLCCPYVWRDPATLPARGWLYGKHYIRKFVSASIGEGGVGKSTLALTEAVAIALRRPLLGKTPTAPGPLKIWYWNGEDPKVEIELRLAAICQRFDLDGRSLEGKLFVDGRDSPISIAAINRSGTLALNDAIIRAITDKITQTAIDVLILDPFVACHNVSENDNMAIDAVIKALGRIAEKADCAIDLDHHTRKPSTGQDGLTLNDARGASAIVYGARSGRIFNQMTAGEAEKAGLSPDDRKAYFRFDRTKANMAPAEFAVWHRLIPVTLPNGEEVAVVEPWQFPDAFEGVATAHMHAVRAKVQEGDYRADIRSKDWVGYAVIDALKLGRAPKDKTKAKNILKTWYESGVLAKVERQDPVSRKTFEFVVPGNWNE